MLDQNDNSDKKTTEDSGNKTPKDIDINDESIVDKTTQAVEEIEKSVAKEAEEEAGKDESNREEAPRVDYSKLSLEKLVDELKKLLKNNPVQKIKSQAEGIKSSFNQQFGALLAKKKEAFLASGGESIDFQFSSPIKLEYNKLLSDYKKQRDLYYADLEKQLKQNLEKRIEVIDKLKVLITEADTATMYKNFRELEKTWRSIGPVSKTRYNDTWKTYHHHVERFYDLLHLSNDFRELDFKHNLEEKINIIKKAEALSEENDINYAFKELQKLHKIWKEDTGPVAKEMREEIWHKFSAATRKIHDRRHEHFRTMRSKYAEIIDKKMAVIAQIDSYDTAKNTTHSHWQKSIKEIESLRQQYFNAGKLPYSKSESVWRKFKAATKKFNAQKNLFYKQEKKNQQENLNKKIALIEYAESLKDSQDWEETTHVMKKIQADWKKIGYVPQKFSDDIWKRFKTACNHYFDRYHQQKNALSDEEQEIVDRKKEFLESLKKEEKPDKDVVLGAINKWRNLGKLPKGVRHLENDFNKYINQLLENLSISSKR